MLNVLDDGPFRYIHCGATGELILTLEKVGNKFVDFDNGRSIPATLRHWKLVARRRIGDRLVA